MEAIIKILEMAPLGSRCVLTPACLSESIAMTVVALLLLPLLLLLLLLLRSVLSSGGCFVVLICGQTDYQRA